MFSKKCLILAILAIAIIGSFVGCGNNAAADTPEKKDSVEAIPVEAISVEKGNISAYFTGTASLEAQEEARVVAKVGGVVEKIFVEEGNHVRTGQALAQLDSDKLALDLAEAEARLKQLENEFNRNKELHQKGIVSTEAYERIKSDCEMAKTKAAQARLMKDYTSIRAPFTGVVAERMIKVGNMVPPNEPCFRVTNFDPLLAILHVPEKDLNKLKKDQTASLEVDALPDETFTGKILRISPVVDPKSGTFKVTVAITDRKEKLKPGMFARLHIVYDIHSNVVLVPKDAVLTEGNESVVFVVKSSDKTVHRKPVETGYINGSNIEIKSGLNAGETVVITGISGLKDGSRIAILDNKKSKTQSNG